MKDFAISDDPAVQAQLDRLGTLSLPQGRLSLDPVRELCARLGNPQDAMPPVFHVAGTNGKGSTCAYLRAILETAGLTVHSATKPHLVRYNERIRVAGALISDAMLAELLAEVLDAAGDMGPSFFEVTTVATFLAFARQPADACVIETGLGGRFDATNVMRAPLVCGIATLGLDHEAFLLVPEDGVPADPLARIAFEKAGIAKRGVPLVTQGYPDAAAHEIKAAAERIGAPLFMRGRDWFAEAEGSIHYRDGQGRLTLPLPALAGLHQADNAALAVAMLRHQNAFRISMDAAGKGIVDTRWPARLQRLSHGPLTEVAPGREIWLDGGHNPDAGQAIARHFADEPPLHLVMGMLSSKNPAAILKPLAGKLLSVSIVPAPGHEAHAPEDFAPFTDLPVKSYPDVTTALAALDAPGDVLIAGSLYVAGEVLRLNGEIPD
ncbi:folylpolyglutamate synthase/dihydrofolate synthase family protein [Novosphingobium sp. ZN18A2]|uniref:bifunctional folylpolyglutamate synthase/dihydrofolate synthase n=1 Tax=Novosphingobium sp. ZN18A2 TaxID=3079861 RepID=UPI0030D57BCA